MSREGQNFWLAPGSGADRGESHINWEPVLNKMHQQWQTSSIPKHYHYDCGLSLQKIEENAIAVMAYHDAAWGNTLLDDATVPQDGWIGDHQVASQLGALNVPC